MDASAFADLFTDDRHVVFGFHGYARAMHQLVHGQPHGDRFHVRGFSEEGTTTTPFDMVVRNRVSRYHLCKEALRRARRRPEGADALDDHCDRMLSLHELYIREHLEDLPEVANWTWTE